MSRILLVWQLGGNLGHIMRLRTLARALRARGHQVTFAFEDTRGAADLTAEGFSVIQAPVLRSSGADLPRDPISYPEMLFHCGFADASALTAAVRAWRALYRMLAPDLIVFDHAPVALLAARSIGIPRVVVGTGFCSPPRVVPMPTIRPWEDICVQRLESSEQRALDTANAVMRALGGEPLRYFHDLFDVEENILATLPELDHYGPRAAVPYWGPIFEANDGDEPQWPAGNGKKVFVYLRPSSPHFEDLIGVLRNQKQLVSLWFAPGLSKESLRSKASESLAFVTKPLKISSAVEHADLAILSAGHGTCAAMMLGGIPMLLAPKNAEQRMLARVIETQGIGAEFRPAKAHELEPSVWRLDETRKSRAKRVAMRYENLRQVEVVATIIDEAVCNFCDGRVARIACDSSRRLSAPLRTSCQ